MNSQQASDSATTTLGERVGARPRHAYVENNNNNGMDQAGSADHDGRVGILARKAEDDAVVYAGEDHDNEQQQQRPLSPQGAILEHNKVMGAILLDEDEEALLPPEQPSVVTEPSTDTEPSSFLLRKNVVVSNTIRRHHSNSSLRDQDRFSDDLSQEGERPREEQDEAEQQTDAVEGCAREVSPYDYDTNWDMIGRTQEEEDGSDQAQQESGASSILAEAAAATAMLASTAAATDAARDPDGTTLPTTTLQGIAPPQHPSSDYKYNVNWDMIGRDATKDEPIQNAAETIDGDGGVASLAEAAAATAMLKSNDLDLNKKQSANDEKEEEGDDPLQQPVPMEGRTRSTPNPRMFSKTARPPRQFHDPHYYYNYHRQQQPEQDTTITTTDTPIEQPLHADEAATLPTTTSFEDLINSPAAADTRSEMNESIATSTSSSSGTTSSTRRRRLQPRRPHAQSWSLSSSSSLRSRSQRGSGSEIPPAAPIEGGNNSTNRRRLRASLDSGMAAVRRWIRSRGSHTQQQQQQPNPRSSRAAQRWQREHSAMQLGEEDLFALAQAGEDPRGMLRHHDDSSVVEEPSMFLRSAMELPAVEEDEEPRQRSLSEPDGNRLRDFFFERAVLRRRTAATTTSDATTATTPTSQQQQQPAAEGSMMLSATSAHLQTAALSSSLFHSPQRSSSWSVEMTEQQPTEGVATSSSVTNDGNGNNNNTDRSGEGDDPEEASDDNDSDIVDQEQVDPDPNREARTRWIRINRRFQLIITMVALVFSLLLFAILVCWVVLTSAYVVSIEKDCDVPLKTYFWLATLQLILDVFRTDIMRVIFRWDTNSNERIPARVIVYNIAYLTYAMLVLRVGIRSVFVVDDSTCPETAPELYQSSTVFVVLSISAWSIIVLGYLVPFCFVAMLLTWNGYTPTSDRDGDVTGGGAGVAAMGAFGGVFPAAYSNSGAPPGCIDQLRVVMLEEFPDDYPQECCICMGDFCPGEVIVATACDHVFHKRCCQEWLRQARTCPVCRTDIPSSIGGGESDAAQPDEPRPVAQDTNVARRRLGPPFAGPPGHAFGREEFHQEVVNLFRILRQHEERRRQRANDNNNDEEDAAANNNDNNDTIEVELGSLENEETTLRPSSTAENQRPHTPTERPPAADEIEMVDMEEGRFSP